MKQGALIYDPCLDRMDIRFGLNTYLGGLHCGECFDCLLYTSPSPRDA